MNRQEKINKILELADEIASKRQLMEILYMGVVDDKTWTQEAFPLFENIRQSLNQLVENLLLRELDNDAKIDCLVNRKKL